MSDQDLYCKIYLNSSGTRDQLLEEIKSAIGGRSHLRTVSSLRTEIDVSHNTERGAGHADDDFLYYPYLLDVTGKQSATRAEFIAEVRALLQAFRALGHASVASCDFEEDLT